ncbi:hypothetical protein F4604DRAFT_1689124 [Suillus subluteus]|nr:hypothetical protein F4604DRAFT_1689124 [Suillus subluteus]
MEKMNLATTTSCDEEPTPSQVHCPYPYVPKALQASYDKSKLSSPSNSPPSSPPRSIGISEPRSMVSEDDDDDSDFPITPNSNRSGGKCHAADASTHQESSHTSESKKHAKLYHPYHCDSQRPISEERHHDRAEHILRRHSCNQYSDGMSTERTIVTTNWKPSELLCRSRSADYHDGDLDWEGRMLGRRGNPSHDLDVPPAPASSIYPHSMAPTQLYAPQPTPALDNYHDDCGNVTHQPPPVTVPSHHPPPMRQMYTPSTFDDYQGNHAAPLNLPIPSNSLSNFSPLPVSSGLDDPGAQVPMFTPLPTFRESHQGNYLPPSISSDLHPGATALMWAPPPLTLSDSGSYQGNWPPSLPSNLHPGAMTQTHAPPPTHNDYNGSLRLPPVMVPSQNPRPGDFAIPLPPALANYRRNFPPPFVSMDSVSTLPPAAPDDVQPLMMLTPTPRSNISERSRKRDAFVLAAEKRLISDAVNDCAMMMPLERENLIQVALADAVKDCLEKAHAIRSNSAKLVKEEVKDFGRRWAVKNARSLDMQLSVPFKLIMAAAEELAFIVIDRGYDLCPSLWSSTSESKFKQTKIKALIDDAMWPLKIIFKKDEKTGQWMAFEHDVVLDVVLGVVRKLKYWRYVNDLDNLYCTAVAAIYCVLMRFSSGKLDRTIEYTAEDFKFMYNMLKKHITDVIEKDENLAKRWSDVKAYTIVRTSYYMMRVQLGHCDPMSTIICH